MGVIFQCQLCDESTIDQHAFFDHLKIHYDPLPALSRFTEPSTDNTCATKGELITLQVRESQQPEEQECFLDISTDMAPDEETTEKQGLFGGDLQSKTVEQRDEATLSQLLCDHCGNKFSLRSHLLDHMTQKHHVKRRRITASKAEKNVAKSAVLDNNEKDCNVTKLTCKTCQRVFHHRNSLAYHLKTHNGKRDYRCGVCGKGFYAGSALNNHLLLHSGEKPFQCELCDRKFTQRGTLEKHRVSVHTDDKEFECQDCGMTFPRRDNLTVHRRIHTGERRYMCETCSKTFSTSGYLQAHRRIHTGEKPYSCNTCQKSFRVQSDMKRHKKIHTTETNPDGVTAQHPTGSPSRTSQTATHLRGARKLSRKVEASRLR